MLLVVGEIFVVGIMVLVEWFDGGISRSDWVGEIMIRVRSNSWLG